MLFVIFVVKSVRGSSPHARFERFIHYVIFHPKRPSEAPGNALEAPRITRNHLRTDPKRCETPRKCPPVFPFVPACLRAFFGTLQKLDTITRSESSGCDGPAPPRACLLSVNSVPSVVKERNTEKAPHVVLSTFI